MIPSARVNPMESISTSPASTSDDIRGGAQRSQHVVEQSIQRYPGLSVGAAIAAGVVLGCLIKRS